MVDQSPAYPSFLSTKTRKEWKEEDKASHAVPWNKTTYIGKKKKLEKEQRMKKEEVARRIECDIICLTNQKSASKLVFLLPSHDLHLREIERTMWRSEHTQNLLGCHIWFIRHKIKTERERKNKTKCHQYLQPQSTVKLIM